MNLEEIEGRRRLGVPAGAVKITSKRGDATAYVYTDSLGRPCGRLFYGRAWKPAWRNWFRNEAERERKIRDGFAAAERQADDRAERQAKRKSAGRGLELGDVLESVWGYEQTNRDYYQVTQLIGATMVEIRPIAAHSEETGWLRGNSAPCPGAFTGDPIRCKATDGAVKVNGYRYASKLEPLATVGGKPVYPAGYWTAYA